MPRFRGFGELSPQQMLILCPDRMPISAPALGKARWGWAPFRPKDLRAVERHLAEAGTVTRFTLPSLHRHLQEFPDSVTGPVSYTHLTLPTKRIV